VQNRTWCQQQTFPPGNSPHTAIKIQTPYQNLHGRFQEGRKSRLLSDMEPPKNNIKTTATKHHPLYNKRTEKYSSLVVASDKKGTKNSKTRTIRNLLGQEGDKITLIWVPSHVEILGNEALDENRREPTAGLSELDNQTARGATTDTMVADRLRNENPKTIKNKEKQH
jgi:hypothetical protein